MLSPGFLAHWYYQVPSLALGVVAWLVVLRTVYDVLRPSQDSTWLAALLRRPTDPFLAATRAVTPAVIPGWLLFLPLLCWLALARITWYLACSVAGMRASFGG